MSAAPFRFGIMLNGIHLYPWQIKVYEEILQTGLATCELLIVKAPEPSVAQNKFKKLSHPHLLFEQYKKRTLNPVLYNPIEYAGLLNIEQLLVKPVKKGKNTELITEPDLIKIKDKNLDFILRLGFGILQGGILEAATWGVWSFHHGDEQEYRGGPPGFWEIFNRSKKQGVILQRLGEKLDAGKLILKRHYAVTRHSYSENVGKLLLQSTDMPAQALRMMANGTLQPGDFTEIKTQAPIYRYPKNLPFLFFLLKLFIHKIRFKWQLLFQQENWIIGYKHPGEKKRRYIAPLQEGEYFADPFTFNDHNKNYILAEHFSYKTLKGNIVLIEPGMNRVHTLIEKTTHLSYPYIFEEDGQLFVMPEEANSGQLNMYKWNSENKTLDFEKTLLDLPAVDASMLKYENLYYLFMGIKGNLPNEKLFIYYAPQLEGPYTPHAANPVKVNPEGARMAGGFIFENGEILRPSQSSVESYGEKIIFQKITRLTTTEYEEEFYSEMKPEPDDPYRCGLHNFHATPSLEVVDLKTRKSGYTAFKSQL
jgi:hypothetical protein